MRRYLTVANLSIEIDAEKTTCDRAKGCTCPWMRSEGQQRSCRLFQVDLKLRSGGGSLARPAVLRCRECRQAEVAS